MSRLSEAEPDQPAPELLEQMICASRAQCADRLTIAGRGYIDLLIGLCHRGFACVSCQAPDQGPSAGEPEADVLWIPSAGNEAELTDTLVRLGRRLRPDGIVLVRDRRRNSRHRLRRLCGVLAESGFAFDRREAVTDGSVILCAHKRAEARTQCAA